MGCCSCKNKIGDERQALLDNEQSQELTPPKNGSWFDEDGVVTKFDSISQANLPKHRRRHSSRVHASGDIVENIMKTLHLEADQKSLAVRAVLSSHNSSEQAAKEWINRHKNDIDANEPITEEFKYKIQTEIEQELISKVTNKIDEKHLHINTGQEQEIKDDSNCKNNKNNKERETVTNCIISDWNSEIIEPFENNQLLRNQCYISHDSHEVRLSKCLHVQRVIFILKIYNKYRHIINIIDIISLLSYGIIGLLNDYLHLNECHNCNDKKYETLFQYATTNLSKCTIGICEMFARNYRDKNISDADNQQRKNTYFGYNYHDHNPVYLYQILDSIHSLCLHSHKNGYKMRQKLIQQIRNNHKENKHNNNYDVDDTLISMDSKFITFIPDKNNNNNNNNNIGSLQIGERFHYWKFMEDCNMNIAKYDNLREEMFENNIYSISHKMWTDTFEKASKWKQTLRGKQFIAKDYKNQCIIYEIPPFSPISISHLMTILFYINYEYLQFKFQNRAMMYDENKDFELLKKNNAEIGNWYKLFTESIVLYGEITPTHNNTIYYHSLNKKQLFCNFNPNFKCFLPTTTSSLVIQNAFNFNKNIVENGIVLSLQNEFNYCTNIFMDCSFMSDYPLQKEHIFYCSNGSNGSNSLQIIDIMEINSEPSEYINAFLLFNYIFAGKYIINDNYYSFQSELLSMIENQIKNNMNEFDVKIDKYIQLLFECFLANNDDDKWIIKSQYKLLDKELQHKLLIFNQINKSNNFHEGMLIKEWRKILNKNKNKYANFKIKIAKEYIFCIKDLKLFKELKYIEGNDIVYDVYDNNIILGQSIIDCKSEPNMYSLTIKLKECANNINGINIEFEVNCKKIQLNISSQNTYLTTNQSFETLIFSFWDLNELTSIKLYLAVKVTKIVYKK